MEVEVRRCEIATSKRDAGPGGCRHLHQELRGRHQGAAHEPAASRRLHGERSSAATSEAGKARPRGALHDGNGGREAEAGEAGTTRPRGGLCGGGGGGPVERTVTD